MAETQDAEYSDEEFGSDHEYYEGGYEDFADEDVAADTAHDAAAHDESPEEADEEGKYDEEAEEDAEQYDNEFDEDEQTAATIDPLAAEIDMMEQRPTAVAADPPVSSLDVEGSPETNVAPNEGHGDASDDSEADYSNDTELDIPAPPKPASLFRDASEENVAKRRSSVPASVITKLSDKDSLRARFGSMPMILPDRSVDVWLETIPHELSPERSDRSRMQSALPVLDEVLAQNPLDEEFGEDEIVSGVATNSDSNTVSIISHSRTRAQSYQGLQSEKTTVPMRKAQSLLYTGSLPSVVEIHAVDGIAEADSKLDSEDPFSDEDDEDNYADSQTSIQSEDENDAAQPVNVERPKSGPSVIPYQSNAPIEDNTLDEHPAETEVNSSVATSDFNSTTLTSTMVAPDEQNLLGESETPEPQPNNMENDDYADEMEDEFPSDTNTPHFEGEDTPHKSSGEASDFDVDEFIEDGRRETETLLLEARTLLLQQHQHDIEPPVEQTTATSGVPTTKERSADLTEEFAKIAEKIGIGDEKYSTSYDDDEEFADGADEAPTQVLSEQDRGDAHDIVGQYEFDTDDFDELESEALIQDNRVTPPQLVEGDKPPGLDSPPNTIAVDEIQSHCETHFASESAPQVENEVSLAIPSETLVSGGIVLEAIKAQSSPVQSPQLAEPLSSNVDEKEMAATTQEPSQSNQPTKTRMPSQPAAPKQSAETVNTSSIKQSSPPMKPSRPPGSRPAPATPVPSSDSQHITTPRSSRNKLRVVASECKSSNPNHISETAGINSIETCASKSPSRRQDSPAKSRHGVSSPRSPSTACSGPYQYLPNEYPPLPRKEPVPRQKVSSKPSTSGEAKRRLLQPVRAPANLRFDLPKMDKAKRDWLFVNMFRHGDDLSKYETFVPPALLAKPPATKETKKRPLSARQVHGNPHTSRFPSSGRKLVQQPNPQSKDRERKWVATTPHDSKLPPYDSILDKYCTTVTSPMIQRQIYQTRHRDLSPQLAFVLEKRVEKHFRKGFYDSFGGVSSSYKTEIVPTSPTDATRSRQLSPCSPTKSGVLEKQFGSLVAEE